MTTRGTCIYGRCACRIDGRLRADMLDGICSSVCKTPAPFDALASTGDYEAFASRPHRVRVASLGRQARGTLWRAEMSCARRCALCCARGVLRAGSDERVRVRVKHTEHTLSKPSGGRPGAPSRPPWGSPAAPAEPESMRVSRLRPSLWNSLAALGGKRQAAGGRRRSSHAAHRASPRACGCPAGRAS
jgi:hypothetical protein